MQDAAQRHAKKHKRKNKKINSKSGNAHKAAGAALVVKGSEPHMHGLLGRVSKNHKPHNKKIAAQGVKHQLLEDDDGPSTSGREQAAGAPPPPRSKKHQQRKHQQQLDQSSGGHQRQQHAQLTASLNAGKKSKGGGSLLDRMRQRLQGGRFRWLNEKLYTSGSREAVDLMAREPELMQQYHEGFREQTKGWPVQPVDMAIRWLSGRPASWKVADLGCGDAKIAASVRQTVHSFDLTATAPGVVACNIADVPLRDAAVDVAVFCLSLMGTDYGAFVEEACRVTSPGGWLWIAEVASRFVDEQGRSILPAFTAAVEALGYELRREDTRNTHFVILEFQKRQQQHGSKSHDDGSGSSSWPALRPCQYKKR